MSQSEEFKGIDSLITIEEPTLTKGEAIIGGLNQIDEGLQMIAIIGGRYDLVKAMVGSNAGAKRLREVVRSNKILYNLVLNIVASKNSRLSADTVGKVVSDFLDTLFDLSQPYQTKE